MYSHLTMFFSLVSYIIVVSASPLQLDLRNWGSQLEGQIGDIDFGFGGNLDQLFRGSEEDFDDYSSIDPYIKNDQFDKTKDSSATQNTQHSHNSFVASNNKKLDDKNNAYVKNSPSMQNQPDLLDRTWSIMRTPVDGVKSVFNFLGK